MGAKSSKTQAEFLFGCAKICEKFKTLADKITRDPLQEQCMKHISFILQNEYEHIERLDFNALRVNIFERFFSGKARTCSIIDEKTGEIKSFSETGPSLWLTNYELRIKHREKLCRNPTKHLEGDKLPEHPVKSERPVEPSPCAECKLSISKPAFSAILVPCNHVFSCQNCIKQLKRCDKCPICKTKIDSVGKYFSA